VEASTTLKVRSPRRSAAKYRASKRSRPSRSTRAVSVRRARRLTSMLDESTTRFWTPCLTNAAFDLIESLKPRVVIAGHKRSGNEDSPRILEETRQYIRDFDRVAETAKAPRELYDQMLKLHPLRMNVNTLWTSALAIKG
jgi:hypothetical protein